jgi:hypothetical protein
MTAMRALIRLCCVLLGIAALAGCAGTPYKSTAPDNVTLQAEVESGGFFTSRDAQVGIYRMGKTCPMDFLGWVDVEKEPVHFGLPDGQKAYLLFVFTQSTGGGYSTRSSGVVLTPRRGAQYLVKVNWVDGLFGGRVQEVSPAGKILHEFEPSHFPCPEEE